MAIEEEPDPGIPEWVVTFGDMMSLLLTFFIMLVSMSEIKEEERFQALVDSMQRQFGHDMSQAAAVPGKTRPRNSRLQKLATEGRARRMNTMKGGDQVKALVGEHPRVRIIRPGDQRTVGGVVFFADGSDELNEENQRQLSLAAEVLAGKSQKIEVRGHTSRKPLAADSPFRDHWDLAYARARRTANLLIAQGIDHRRIRISASAETEPADNGDDPAGLQENDRAEVFLLNEVTRDPVASPEPENNS